MKARFQRASQTVALAPSHSQENLHPSVNTLPKRAAKAVATDIQRLALFRSYNITAEA
jgi:hypothetical protein